MSKAWEDFYRCPDLLSIPSSGPVLESFSDRRVLGLPLSSYRGEERRPGSGDRSVRRKAAVPAGATVEDLRFERYAKSRPGPASGLLSSRAIRRIYDRFRPLLTGPARKNLQRVYFRGWDRLPFPQWPVDTSVECLLEDQLLAAMRKRGLSRVPFIWFWPQGAPAAAMMTHDVEMQSGLDFVPGLMDLDETFGFQASFQLVPEKRYRTPGELLQSIRRRGFEVNVHGLDHEGNLFSDKESFSRKAKEINRYVREFGAEGFRSPCMYRNVDWYSELEISFDMSVPNVAHLEPQGGGCCTVFPYYVGEILELPLTTIEDYSLLSILGEYSIDLWKKQIHLIMERHGLISLIVHPDYILAKRERSVYEALLAHLASLRDEKNVWFALPGDVNRWWRERSEMTVTLDRGEWRIEGRGRERARLGFAAIHGEHIQYTVEEGLAAPAREEEAEGACRAASGAGLSTSTMGEGIQRR